MNRFVFPLALALALLTQLSLFAEEKKEKATSDTDFLIKASVCGVCEVRLADQAAKHASDDKIKAFAKHLSEDHSRANAKLSEFARLQKVAVVAGQEKETREKLDRLSKLKGNDYDREFLKMMVADHEKAISLFESQSKSGTDGDLKKFAADTLPTLKKHLEEARELLSKIKD